ncbi:MAG: pyridoxamine 5'-phosphate oxidase family protein [Candidatus Thorarchaeota archaeon]|nr:MAG: pyridoxamine 5'-phosphate oxidase family protein [Candidatus Thorarchaeota archaeon]
MMEERFSFEFVEKQIRKKTFGVLSTIDKKGRPHSTGVLYGVSPPESSFALYVIVGEDYVKTKNVRRNPNVSLVVTFPHYWVRFAPAAYVRFRGTAEILPLDDPDGQWAFQQQRILRMAERTELSEDEAAVFIKINSEPTIFCYGLGLSLMEFRRTHTEAGYRVKIPENRR